MTAVTVELEAELVEGLARVAGERRTSIENLIVSAAWRFLDDDQADSDDFTPEQIAEIEEGMAQLRRGEGVPHEQVVAETRARFGW